MKSYSVTDVGQKRQVNQDYIFSSEEPVGNLPNLFVVADGMGGHKAGDFASSFAVQTLLQTIREDENQNPIIIIRHAIEEANRKYWKRQIFMKKCPAWELPWFLLQLLMTMPM